LGEEIKSRPSCWPVMSIRQDIFLEAIPADWATGPYRPGGQRTASITFPPASVTTARSNTPRTGNQGRSKHRTLLGAQAKPTVKLSTKWKPNTTSQTSAQRQSL
jgi:hypothetical protein